MTVKEKLQEIAHDYHCFWNVDFDIEKGEHVLICEGNDICYIKYWDIVPALTWLYDHISDDPEETCKALDAMVSTYGI